MHQNKLKIASIILLVICIIVVILVFTGDFNNNILTSLTFSCLGFQLLILGYNFKLEKKSKAKFLFILGTFSIVLSVISITFFSVYSSKEIYGNDKESIVRSIKSNEIIENKNDLEIADIVDVDEDMRIVGFFSNGGTGVATFIKNKSNNYVMKQIDIHENTMTTYFNIVNRDTDEIKFVVVSNWSSLDKIVVKNNGKYKESKENLINKMSVSVFDYNLPEPDSNSSASIPIEVSFLGVNGGPVSFD